MPAPAENAAPLLIQVGMIGLMDASNRHVELSGAKFETYASSRIRGAMLDELRREDWVPRLSRNIVRKVDTATNDLRQSLGRQPKESETADHMGMSLSMYQSLVDKCDVHQVIGFEDFYEADNHDEFLNGFCLEEALDPLSKLIKKEFDIALDAAIGQLPEREKFVIDMRKKEVTLKETGVLLGLCESRVCQLYGEAVASIRETLCMQGLLETA